MLQDFIIQYGSPTLAGLKTGNMFQVPVSSVDLLNKQLKKFNNELNSKDIYVRILKKTKEKALIYIYRKSKLQEDLQNEDSMKILMQFGYKRNQTVEQHIFHLQSRVKQSLKFPHEVGLFLGYPAHDVDGFISLGSKGCVYSGCWKVYRNVSCAQKQFLKFKKCTRIYKEKFLQGTPLARLAVAA